VPSVEACRREGVARGSRRKAVCRVKQGYRRQKKQWQVEEGKGGRYRRLFFDQKITFKNGLLFSFKRGEYVPNDLKTEYRDGRRE